MRRRATGQDQAPGPNLAENEGLHDGENNECKTIVKPTIFLNTVQYKWNILIVISETFDKENMNWYKMNYDILMIF